MRLLASLFALLLAWSSAGAECLTRGTGDMGIIIERASGSLQVVDTTAHRALFRV
ncbi:MAG TPA: protein nirF, partial [Sedimenticola sp.]|nr:protein nirF [Sedimenticola sp.]